MSTITKSQQKAIRDLVKTMHIPTGLGTEEEACSLACINLALTGELTARIPDCMSEVIGQWIIGVQDRMPDDLRNSAEWKRLLPLAAGTGRDHEPERFRLLMVWMNDTVLVSVQPVADAGGYGTEWRAMTDAGSKATAADAADAAGAADAAERAQAWIDFAPCKILAELIAVG